MVWPKVEMPVEGSGAMALQHSVIAGGVAGAVEAVAVQPLDMVKTRFQLNPGTNPSMLGELRLLLAEGGPARLYRGLLPEMAGNIPTRTGMYWGKNFAAKHLRGDGPPTFVTELAAGSFSGLPEAFATTPFQVVKVRLQNLENNALYRNSLDCFWKVLTTEGPFALLTGLPTTVCRNGVWNGAYFASMMAIRREMEILGLTGKVGSMLGGFTGGVFATCCNAPFDMAKSRIQGGVGDGGRYRSTFQTLLLVGREEGIRGLYKGFVPKAWRMGVGGAVGITTFEFVMAFLSKE